MPWYVQNVIEAIARVTGKPVDQASLAVCMVLCLLFSQFHRIVLHPRRVSATTRYVAALLMGVYLTWVCFGWDILHVWASSSVAYILMRTLPPDILHRYVFAWTLFYQSMFYAYHQFTSDAVYVVNISGSLMVLTQKITYVSFFIQKEHAGQEATENKEERKRLAPVCPTPLEFFSFVFHLSSVFAGPAFSFSEYKRSIHGTQYLEYEKSKQWTGEPSPYKTVLANLVKAVLCFFIFVKAFELCPLDALADAGFIENTSVTYKMLYAWMVIVGFRYRYYVIWLLGESCEHLFGIGFNGYNENGSGKWDRTIYVDIIGYETSMSLKVLIDRWNISSAIWLRRLVYDVAPFYPTLLTMVVSATWHGFRPGYFLTFLTIGMFVYTSRQVRRKVRPYVESPTPLRYVYHVITFFATHAFLTYGMVPFIVMTFSASIAFWRSTYFIGHVACVLALVVLPFIPSKPRPVVKSNGHSHSNGHVTSLDSNHVNDKKDN